MVLGLQDFIRLKNIVSSFDILGEIETITSYGSGHINDTFQVKNCNDNFPDYLLQRINSYVFKDVPLLINNIRIVTHHIREKLKEAGDFSADQQVLTLIRTKTNNWFLKDDNGDYWRMYIFLKNTITYDLVATDYQASEGGKAFGRFQALLSDLNADSLGETIPDFHNIEKRLKKLQTALINDTEKRRTGARTEVEFVLERQKSMCGILEMAREGRLPLRITHNDTKFNNVLLNKEDRAQCIIDLDTVMPGYVAYDFGDAIRSIVNTAAEDEADTSKIDININLFEAFSRGFLQETWTFLNQDEVYSLTMGALLLPYIVGVRFLTDHLEGDNYFKIQFSGHNLQRARAQFQLLKKLEDNYDNLQAMVQHIAREYQINVPIDN